MALKRHHKIILGGFSTIVIIFMITMGILMFTIFARTELNYNDLKSQLTETDSKINTLTTNLIETKESISSLDESFQSELNEIKATTSEDFSGMIEDAIESVVTIRTDVSQGTGFIVKDQGYIVTNAHVLVGGHEINAITSDQEIIQASLVGFNTQLDIALLKISGNYQEIELADSEDVQIGENVIAIGNPLGLQFSVTEGIVSAVDRPGSNGIEAYIQTDAALNPGNSGGPLINKQGEVIGINNFKVGGGENLGFALESNFIKNTVNAISQEKLNETLIS